MKTGLNQYKYICVLIFLTIFLFFPSGAFASAADGVYLGTPPTISQINQFKLDSQTILEESGITVQDTVVFKAIADDFDGDEIKIEIELRQITEPFTGIDDGGILISEPVYPLAEAVITRSGLVSGQYHWRARAVDFYGLVSDWQEFGIAGNVDFEVKLVPLYTQVRSLYPSDDETRGWFEQIYANGLGNTGDDPCGPFIKDCGCAITSAVMLLRYHGITSAVDNQDVNPLTFNTWLNNNNGYLTAGNLNWPKVSEYSKTSPTGLARIHYDGRKDFTDIITLNLYLASLNPVIIYNNDFGHFLVADGELSNTYTVKDPAWYRTKKLDEEATNSSLKIRDYNNQFAGLRLYSPLVFGGPVDGISLTLASPAELLVIDSFGRRLGKNPIANISYNEIPDGSYGQEGIGNADTEIPISTHKIKTIWIPQPIPNSKYNIKVIGTDTGVYTLDSLAYDSQSQPHSQKIQGNTQSGLTDSYILNFTPDQPENIIIEPVDNIPPEAKIYFDKNNKTLKIEGIDNLSQTQVVQTDKVFTISDDAGNTLKLNFEELKQHGKEIKAELKSLQYNNQSVIGLPETDLKYEWSINKDTGEIKELEQKIDVKDTFKIQAKYNHKKNETEIKIKLGDKKPEQKQTLPGFAIIKLITKSGSLDFEF